MSASHLSDASDGQSLRARIEELRNEAEEIGLATLAHHLTVAIAEARYQEMKEGLDEGKPFRPSPHAAPHLPGPGR